MPPAPEPSAERRQRFKRLRLLIHDPPRRQRAIFLFSLLALAAVSLLASMAEFFPVLPFDLAPTRELQEISSGIFLRLMVFTSLFGYLPWSTVVIAVATVGVGALLGWRDGAYLLLLTAAQGLANQLIKRAVGRPRPLDSLVDVFTPVQGNSFPSGHVMFYTVFFGFLFFLALTRLPRSIWRAALLAIAGLLIAAIGPSRMYLGAHWLSDVLAAYLFGLIILAFGIEFYLASLAPRAPEEQQGALGEHERREQ
jgi:undecaprenyl-diphosphatase